MYWITLALPLCLAMCRGDTSLRDLSGKKTMIDPQVLPHEGDSRSELLAARAIFAIEVESLSPSAWQRDPSTGLETRVVSATARLIHVYKGSVTDRGSFQVALPQRREDPLTISDYHGFWSHRELRAGRYIVFSNGDGRDPAALLDDTLMLDLRPDAPPLPGEISLAIDVERRVAKLGAKESDVEVLQALQNTHATSTDTFGRYACARVSPPRRSMTDSVQEELMQVVSSPGTTESLRGALVACVYDASAEDPSERRTIKVTRRFLTWAQQPEAEPMLDQMLQIYLYNLIFRPGEAPLLLRKVGVRAEERALLTKIFSNHPSERATEIIRWLNPGAARE